MQATLLLFSHYFPRFACWNQIWTSLGLPCCCVFVSFTSWVCALSDTGWKAWALLGKECWTHQCQLRCSSTITWEQDARSLMPLFTLPKSAGITWLERGISYRIKPLLWMPIYLEANKKKNKKKKPPTFILLCKHYGFCSSWVKVLCLLSSGGVSHPVCHIHPWERTQLHGVLWQAESWDPLSPSQMAVLPPCCVFTVYKIQKKLGEWLEKEWCTSVLMFVAKKKVNMGSLCHIWISWKWLAGILPCF